MASRSHTLHGIMQTNRHSASHEYVIFVQDRDKHGVESTYAACHRHADIMRTTVCYEQHRLVVLNSSTIECFSPLSSFVEAGVWRGLDILDATYQDVEKCALQPRRGKQTKCLRIRGSIYITIDTHSHPRFL